MLCTHIVPPAPQHLQKRRRSEAGCKYVAVSATSSAPTSAVSSPPSYFLQVFLLRHYDVATDYLIIEIQIFIKCYISFLVAILNSIGQILKMTSKINSLSPKTYPYIDHTRFLDNHVQYYSNLKKSKFSVTAILFKVIRTFFAITWIWLIGSRQNLAWTYYLTLRTSLRKNSSFFSKSKMAASGQKFAMRYTYGLRTNRPLFAITSKRLIGSRQNLAWTYYLTLGTTPRKNFSFFSKSKMAAAAITANYEIAHNLKSIQLRDPIFFLYPCFQG